MEKILVLCDDYWHPAEVIERGLTFLCDEFDLDFVHDAKDILTPEFIRKYPVILNAKTDELTAANRNTWFDEVTECKVADLADYVKEGNGFISLHSGNAFFWDKTRDYCEFNGCSFVKHPSRCDIEVKPICDHPITEGIKPFVIHDEHYECDHYSDDIQVIMESTSETGGTQVAAYVHTLGEGRMCSLMPGHILSVFENEEYRKVIRHAIRWCMKEI